MTDSDKTGSDRPFLLFALGATRALGEEVASALGTTLAPLEEREFEDGEHKSRPLVDVRGRRVVVLHSLHGAGGGSGNDKFCRLLFFVGALKDAGASFASVVAPYLCYARKDRRTKSFDPVTTRYVGQILEAVGVDHLATVDVHNPAAFENAFRRGVDHIETTRFFAAHLAGALPGEKLAVVSPDAGGMKRVEALRAALEETTGQPVGKGFMEKVRSSGQVSGDLFAGDVEGRCAIILDDLVATGGSMARTARECRRRGASRVLCVAAHGLFSGGAPSLFGSPDVERVIVTDTVPVSEAVRAAAGGRLDVLPVAPLLAERLSAWGTAWSGRP
ncbi:ribose-phosphate diphosphokinase [Alsobacter sp. SYSU M60028]|uniref:ribose-phosphate diphosphokinase n=1 Tax=Alsobacter ponti TaxID=2962936 RepID=A0ABT1LAZ7_9HYPH|nr:ribose-phosphate diphosphokinase [Alsobacter ponti]MCP8937940.1 ribose-phosphate diphosphokinase [Alsobacter ponti]